MPETAITFENILAKEKNSPFATMLSILSLIKIFHILAQTILKVFAEDFSYEGKGLPLRINIKFLKCEKCVCFVL